MPQPIACRSVAIDSPCSCACARSRPTQPKPMAEMDSPVRASCRMSIESASCGEIAKLPLGELLRGRAIRVLSDLQFLGTVREGDEEATPGRGQGDDPMTSHDL